MAWASLIVGAGCGGHTEVVKPKPLCELVFPQGHESEVPVRPQEWIELILESNVGADGLTGERNCLGERIDPPPQPTGCAVEAPYLGTPEPQPLTENSIIERVLPGRRSVVWIVTHRYPNGDGFGPVAVTRHEGDRVIVGALGNLRMRSTRVELDVWDINGRSVLVARGETCADENAPGTCKRAANVLVYADHRLLAVPISTREGQCLDMPWIELHMESDQDLSTGWNRHFEINTSVDHDARYLVITEQVNVEDSDPRNPGIPARTVRKVDTERFIHVEGHRLVTKQRPLWPSILPVGGKLQLTKEPE